MSEEIIFSKQFRRWLDGYQKTLNLNKPQSEKRAIGQIIEDDYLELCELRVDVENLKTGIYLLKNYGHGLKRAYRAIRHTDGRLRGNRKHVLNSKPRDDLR